jgi:cell division protein FtsZ
VNICADQSLNLDEVGLIMERVMNIASDDVDVKYGTSLDPALNGEMRVTVVATGLGSKAAAAANPVVTPITAAARRPVNLDEPAIIRGGNKKAMPEALRELVMDEQLLDIPAFLRAQAD